MAERDHGYSQEVELKPKKITERVSQTWRRIEIPVEDFVMNATGTVIGLGVTGLGVYRFMHELPKDDSSSFAAWAIVIVAGVVTTLSGRNGIISFYIRSEIQRKKHQELNQRLGTDRRL